MRLAYFTILLVLLAGALEGQRLRTRGERPQQPTAQAQQQAPVLDPAHGLPGARFPALSPDGRTVVFALHGAIWSMPAQGGRATRLTLHGSYNTRPLVTPDGKQVVFVSDRNGSYDIYVMPIDGGPPQRLTHHNAGDVPTGFSRDGKYVLFQSRRMMSWNRGAIDEVWRVPLTGGTPERLTRTGGHSATTPDDGETLFFVGGSSDAKVLEYTGSANDRLYTQTVGSAAVEILPFAGNTREPRVTPDGSNLFFTREIEGHFQLFRYDLAYDQLHQLTSLDERGVSQTTFSADFSRVAFVWKFYLWSLDLAHPEAVPALMKVEIREDSPDNEKVERRFTSGIERAHLSPDGRRIVFSLGGDLWIMDSGGGTARQLTDDVHANEGPKFSPDGRTISFYSNRSGNSDIWLMDVNGQNLRQFTNHPADDFFQNWSPDGQSLVFCSTRDGAKNIWVQGRDGAAAVQLTNTPASDDDPVFSPDGRYIAFDSGREGANNQNIWIMDADGSNQRRVYGTPSVEEVPAFSPDGRFLLFDRFSRSGMTQRREVVMTDVAGSGEVVVASGFGGQFTPDGKEILFLDNNGRLNVAPAPVGILTGRVVPFVAVRNTTRKAEMLKAFDEAHKAYAENFYDPTFHGKDWAALGRQYRALVESCTTREEFLYYLNRMVGEVSASHSGANANTIETQREQTAHVGMELRPEVYRGNQQRLKVLSVERGGPADQAWIREGDYIFRVERTPLAATDNFYERLDGKVGQDISFYVADNPEGRNPREVTVKGESFAQRRARHYQQWVTGNKQAVTQQSRGQMAYVHIAGMMQPNLIQFQAELSSQPVQNARGLIIDVRDNGGGNIHQALIDLLSRKPYAYMQTREGQRTGQPNVHWDRPIVILINERSYSDAEVFPHAMKAMGLATIVGVQTPGAVIGTNNITLSDGTQWRLPRVGFFNLDGTNQEHNGCKPDIEVRVTPEDALKGRDPQLEKAIEVLREKIRGGRTEVTADAKEPEGPQPEKPQTEGEFSGPYVLPGWED
jgi:tricorn protease